jgi:hypothetical protein
MPCRAVDNPRQVLAALITAHCRFGRTTTVVGSAPVGPCIGTANWGLRWREQLLPATLVPPRVRCSPRSGFTAFVVQCSVLPDHRTVLGVTDAGQRSAHSRRVDSEVRSESSTALPSRSRQAAPPRAAAQLLPETSWAPLDTLSRCSAGDRAQQLTLRRGGGGRADGEAKSSFKTWATIRNDDLRPFMILGQR